MSLEPRCVGYMGTSRDGNCVHPIKFKVFGFGRTIFVCGRHLASVIMQLAEDPGDVVRAERLA